MTETNGGRVLRRRKKQRGAEVPSSSAVSAETKDNTRPPKANNQVKPASPPRTQGHARGRRLYEPARDNSKTYTATRAQFSSPRGRRSVQPALSAARLEAQELAKSRGIPLVHAYRVLNGQATLNDVLKSMMRKEQLEHLAKREGIARELAGQVASGHLSKKRALILTKMRNLRKFKRHLDAIKVAEIESRPVALLCFEHGWLRGRIHSASTYEFEFIREGSTTLETFFKHNIKLLCDLDAENSIRESMSINDTIRAEGLKQTEDRGERVRFDDDEILDFIENKQHLTLTFRDGATISGHPASFGRWDVQLNLTPDSKVVVFFHALHPISANLSPTS